MLKTTLLPLNLKEPEQKLIELAGFITHFRTETVYLCHILSGNKEARHTEVEQTLQETAKLFQARGMATEVQIRRGSIANQVCRLATELEADYITIPWKKKNVIKRSILSSPDIDILRICSFPTFIFKQQGYLKGESIPETIVYATDCREADKKVLPYLKSAPDGAKTLHFLHVRERAPDPESDRIREQELYSRLDDLARECRKHYAGVEKMLAVGSIRSQIARIARKMDADLIVIGRNEKQKPMDNLLGSTAESLPHKTTCSVLIIA